MTIPNGYLERVYAGVLGKLIGVYLGRPFEGWTYQRIMKELGPINYYVHEQLGDPLVITDDDVAGTFTFIRALEDYGISPDLSSEDIGKAWLNYIVKERSILWWGGNGNSTEHTAWINLHKGIPAPDSGSIATNGTTVAEQIGAQIFIDGWAMVAPGKPEVAAKLANSAGSVSHDGDSVHAAMLWAAMEAAAFGISDIDELLDIGLAQIPNDCLIARLIADLRKWHKENDSWEASRQLIEDNYGYSKYPGNCHVVPNHALMVMTMLYAPDDFQRAQMIVNTSGWDTDCNAGNVGCLMGIMHGLEGIEEGPDWRGPIADRLLISSADGGNSINDAVRMAYYITNLGLQMAGSSALPAPKSGAQFHFSLPGSQQGFRTQAGIGLHDLSIENVEFEGARALSVSYEAIGRGQVAGLMTPTFSPQEVVDMRTYDLMATPLVYPGQIARTRLIADKDNNGTINTCIRLRVYDENNDLVTVDGPVVAVQAGAEAVLEWKIPEFGGHPIAEIGIAISCADAHADGSLIVDYLSWDGCPDVTLYRPEGDGDFWHRAWVNSVQFFSKNFMKSFRISHDNGEGMIIHGTRQWTDYQVAADVALHLGDSGGLAVRVQGLRRYYLARLNRTGSLQIVRVRDEVSTVLAETSFPVELEKVVNMVVSVSGSKITVNADGVKLDATDEDTGVALTDGGIGLVIENGALSSDSIKVSPIV